MGQINEIIGDIKSGKQKTVRLQYMPYDINIAKKVWYQIAKKFIYQEIQPAQDISSVWLQLIKYVHGDPECELDINKSVFLMGRTGSGKSQTMKIMNEYMKIDNVRFKRNNKIIPFIYSIFSARDIVSDFNNNGYDGLEKYVTYSIICIDDLGSEPNEAVYYGTRLNVICEVIEERYAKGLTTHFTTNLDLVHTQKYYNDRVYSRIIETCNIVKLNDKDFRIPNTLKLNL